jgi:hypothetical protein
VSIGKFECLTDLRIQKCVSSKELHESIGKLKCLTHLNLRTCVFLEDDVSIGELMFHSHLKLFECGYVKEFPRIIGEWDVLPIWTYYINPRRSFL